MGDTLTIAKSGLFAAKKALETTGHNISNANTEGYSRQKVYQSANPPIAIGNIVEGTGVRIDKVARVHDEFLERRHNDHISSHNYHKERTNQLSLIESIFNEVNSDGLNKILNNFFNSFKELANQPEDEAVRSLVRDNAKLVVRDFRRIRESLNEQARNINLTLEKNSIDINKICKHIADLNKEIIKLEVSGGETGDLRDQRDNAIRELAKTFRVHTYQDNKGNFVVSAKGVGTLVSSGETAEIIVGAKPKQEDASKRAGDFDIYFKNRQYGPIGDQFREGSLAAIIETKIVDIKNMQEGIDNLAYEFINMVNAIHRRGYVHRQIKVDEQNNPVNYDQIGKTTGINFFKEPLERYNAALSIDLSDEVKGDLTNVVTALTPNGPGDNRIALGISKLQDEKILHEGTRTLQEQYLQMIANIGLEAGKARLDKEQSEGILIQTKAFKERISGVSLDEEAANMVRYQHAYDAAAKVMKTADEMFQSLISIKN